MALIVHISMYSLVGAGLQWAMMLQKGSSLIEVAWPTHGWPFRYSSEEMKGESMCVSIKM